MKKSWVKFCIGWGLALLVRLIPGRPPSVEPIMTVLMPFSKRYGWLSAFAFGFVSMMAYDAVTSGIGIWSWATAGVYGVVGILSYFYFKNRSARVSNFVKFSIIGTLIFDGLTMLIGPIFASQTLSAAIVGQIPFTAIHLVFNAAFSIVSVFIYAWVAEGEQVVLQKTRTSATISS